MRMNDAANRSKTMTATIPNIRADRNGNYYARRRDSLGNVVFYRVSPELIAQAINEVKESAYGVADSTQIWTDWVDAGTGGSMTPGVAIDYDPSDERTRIAGE